MLTNRASAYLSTLERRPFVPTRLVESIFQDRGDTLFPSWLEFHDQYAGYVEFIGGDVAIWGLIHEKALWLESLEPLLDSDVDEEDGETLYVTCADVHPTYNYRLDQHGQFTGPSAVTFATHVERIAVIREFCALPFEVLFSSDLREPDVRERILAGAVKVVEASDQYFEYSMSASHLLICHRETDRYRGWVRRAS